jgi:hypothetical protein
MDNRRIDFQLAQQLEQMPETDRDLLVQVQDIDQSKEDTLESLGLNVRRRFRLVPSYAVRGPGRAALKLLEYSWVQRIEEDLPVHT